MGQYNISFEMPEDGSHRTDKISNITLNELVTC